MQATWRGWVAAGSIDLTGVFGDGRSLDGRGFKLLFTYDPDTPGARRDTTEASDEVYGETGLGTLSPVRSAALTINGHTVGFDTTQVGAIRTGDLSGSGNIVQYGDWRSDDGGVVRTNSIGAAVLDALGAFPSRLDETLPLTRFARAGWGHFALTECDQGSCSLPNWTTYTSGTLRTASVEITAIPAPTALPLLASALAALGLAGWRRRHAAAADA